VAYTIEFSPLAARQFRKLRGEVRTLLKPHIEDLAENPRPAGARAHRSFQHLERPCSFFCQHEAGIGYCGAGHRKSDLRITALVSPP